jgi:hypothetical protein
MRFGKRKMPTKRSVSTRLEQASRRTILYAEMGNYLKPHEVLMSKTYPAATKAVKRFASHLDMKAARDLIDNIPSQYGDLVVLKDTEKELFERLLEQRLSLTILPVAKAYQHQ